MDNVELAKLLPRAYQEEIFARAQTANIIAALDTGSGKTFIGALLIKSIAAQTSTNGKKVVFIVPKVPLVEQQRHFLSEHTPLTVRGYWGAMGVDIWNKSRWRLEFKQADVLVMTAQIFYDVIAHAFWTMDQVSLIVFDECHHAQKNHPYNMIMAEHYTNCPHGARPKVFGMTASPIWNLKKPQESLRQLEYNLFSKVLAVREHTDELLEHSPRPIEVIRQYATAPIAYPEYVSPTLWDRLESAEVLHFLDKHLDSLRTRYAATMQALGPYGADYFLYTHLSLKRKELLRQDHDEYLKQANVALFHDKNSMEIDVVERVAVHSPNTALDRLQRILESFEACIFSESQIPDTWMSPKFLAVVDIVRKHSSPTFQGILFVEQRQIASTLSSLLPRISELRNWIRCAELMGHGDSTKKSNNSKGMGKGMGLRSQRDVVQSFREGTLNLLVATSVAEEGLDFPACDLVIRFDTLRHMVGYVQSRGRARQRTSTFVVMIEENDAIELARYKNYKDSEPGLKLIYQGVSEDVDEEDDRERDNPDDIAERECYVVQSTGAMLTYSSAISLLNNLCSIIPRDKYTPVHQPKYSGDFEAQLELPSALPLAKEKLAHMGPPKRTKKEAKRAVAFQAVKELHRLGVFDDHLSPVKATTGEDIEDADGRPIAAVNDVPEMMDVLVRDPWRAGPDWWLHIVYLDDRRCAGLVTGTRLPRVDLIADGVAVVLGAPLSIAFDSDEKSSQLELMQNFTKMGLWWCVTGTPVDLPLTCYLVPLDSESDQPDWETMERALINPMGTYDWNGITDKYCGHLMVMNNKKYGRPLLLRRIRNDLSLQSKPNDEICEGNFDTYADYFVHKYSSSKVKAVLPSDGPVFEVSELPRRPLALYPLKSLNMTPSDLTLPNPSSVFLLPQYFCKWIYITQEVYRAFHVLCRLCHRITDIYRVCSAREELNLASVADDLLVEALTIPCASAGFNNQRLETLGDSVLKLGVVVYLFNRFPHHHEGQLDLLKRNCISNRLLLARARELGLERYLTSEARRAHTWRYVVDDCIQYNESNELPYVQRKFARRSLQDSMEASLGASFLTGGIDMTMRMGTSLGLCFGGSVPWRARYGLPERVPPAALFNALQTSLGYTFRNGALMLEAVTHPSFQSPVLSCYQRLEFLGDALIDLVVVNFLFAKFPEATSGQLSWARSRAVCAPALAAVAVKRLSLHKFMLANNVELNKAISNQIPCLTAVSYEDLVTKGWKFDPPKAISDLLESLLGAVLVDSGYDFGLASRVSEKVLQDILAVLNLNLPRDPVSELMVWTQKAGCQKVRFRKLQSNPLVNRNDSISVLVHEQTLVGPVMAANLSLAKGLASAEALAILSDSTSDSALNRLCDCRRSQKTDMVPPDVPEKELDDETEEGFALKGQILMNEVLPDDHTQADLNGEGDDVEEEMQVEAMVLDGLDVEAPEQLSELLISYDGMGRQDMDC